MTQGRITQSRLPILWLLGALLLVAGHLGRQHPLGGPQGDVETYYVLSHPIFAIGLPAAFCLFAATYFALGLTPTVRVRPILGYAHLAISLLGAALMQFPATALRVSGGLGPLTDPAAAFKAWSQLAGLGYALLLASLLWFAYVVIDGWRGAKVTKGG